MRTKLRLSNSYKVKLTGAPGDGGLPGGPLGRGGGFVGGLGMIGGGHDIMPGGGFGGGLGGPGGGPRGWGGGFHQPMGWG
jgi:hypothetical protein